MATVTIPSTSIEYYVAEIDSDNDPTGGSIEFAFTTSIDDDGASWVAGAWYGSAVLQSDSTYATKARILVGPAQAITLTEGVTYVAQVRVTASPEVPVMDVGTVRVT